MDAAYIRRLEAGKQLGSAYSLLEIARALGIRPGVLLDVLADTKPKDEWLTVADPDLRVWLNTENLNRLSRVSRKAISAIIKTEIEGQRPISKGLLAAFVQYNQDQQESVDAEVTTGEIKPIISFPDEIAHIIDEVTERDYSHFLNNPGVAEYKRNYEAGEFWPDLEGIQVDQVKVLVIKHPNYDLIIRVAISTTQEGEAKPPVIRVAYTKETLATLKHDEAKVREIVDDVLEIYLKTKPELFDLPTEVGGVSKNRVKIKTTDIWKF